MTLCCVTIAVVFPFNSVEIDEILHLDNKENSGFSHKTCLLTKCPELNTVNYEHIYSNTDDVDMVHEVNCNTHLQVTTILMSSSTITSIFIMVTQYLTLMLEV